MRSPSQSDDTEPLLAAFAGDQLLRNGVPDAQAAEGRSRCHTILLQVLGADLQPDGLRCSPLGPTWTDLFHAHVLRPIDPDRLAGIGWLPLNRLLGHGGHAAGGAPANWAVIEDGRVLAGVQLSAGAPADPVRTVLSRCRRQREVRLRDVLELRELRRFGSELPAHSAVLRAAAEIESGLGGRVLAPWATGRVAPAPAPLGNTRPWRSQRQLTVAVSGVDGSGKSTLRSALVENLSRAGVAASTVWVRPGMGIGPLTSVAAWGKRALGQDPAAGIRAVAAQHGPPLPSRSGAVGWGWAMLVSASFLLGVWRQHLAASGVVVYDRHLVDALATLDFAYEGVDLEVHRWLVKTLLPRADVRIYLDVPTEISVERKPDDLIGAAAIDRQLAAYEHWLEQVPPAYRLDATAPPGELLTHALQLIASTR